MNIRQMIEKLRMYPEDTEVIFSDSANGMFAVEDISYVYLEDMTTKVIVNVDWARDRAVFSRALL